MSAHSTCSLEGGQKDNDCFNSWAGSHEPSRGEQRENTTWFHSEHQRQDSSPGKAHCFQARRLVLPAHCHPGRSGGCHAVSVHNWPPPLDTHTHTHTHTHSLSLSLSLSLSHHLCCSSPLLRPHLTQVGLGANGQISGPQRWLC